MGTQTKTIQSVAKEIYDNMVYSERDNKTKFCHLNNDVEWQRDIIHKAHLGRLPNDDIYDHINTILGELCELDQDATEDDAREALYNIEPDAYTSNLTAWLNNDNRNVYYLEEAMQLGVTDGFQLLGTAQKMYIEEIGNDLINAISEYIDN